MDHNSIWSKIEKGVFIIAEAGKNFIQTEEEQPIEVYLDNAKKLVLAAKEAGADAVKFQTHNVDDEVLNINFTSPHFSAKDRYSWVKRNTEATPLEFWQELKKYSDELGIVFFSTPMSRGAAEKLAAVGVELWKIGSGDILDFVILDFIRNTGKPIIISSGMSTQDEVDTAINFLCAKNPRVALLHCVSEYPCPPEKLHLRTIEFFQSRYNLPIGFSDHSLGYESAVAAVAMGAKIIEKHFSFDRRFFGSDHKVSMLPREFCEMAKVIKNMESSQNEKRLILQSDAVKRSLGAPEKILQEVEAKYRSIFRKSLIAARDIPAGARLTPDLLYAMRPQGLAGGIPSEKYEEVLGKILVRPLKKYEPVTWEALS